jgi:hypothetical protein
MWLRDQGRSPLVAARSEVRMRSMWRRLRAIAAGAVLLVLPVTAHAVVQTVDHVPAATLLLPYFEVDPTGTDARGVTTLLSITDASATAILVHVTVWTDASVPVTGFNVYFTGFDTITMDLQQVLAGTLPTTASDGQDPMDAISPQGDFSQDINFASCTEQLPPGPVDADTVARWQAQLTGKPAAASGLCSGFDHGDGILRGYVTLDVVNNCTLRNPGDTGYFAPGGAGDATNQNVMWGTWTLFDKATKRRHTGPLPGLEASATDPETSVPGEYTFYGRYVNWTAADNREPLATNFGMEFDAAGGAGRPGRTTLLVWRDPKVKQTPFSCSFGTNWRPLAQEGVFFWDQQENNQSLSTTIQAFPIATQKVTVDSTALPTSLASGWLYLNLNASIPAAGPNPPEDPDAAQAWVEVLQTDDDAGAYGVRGRLGVTHHPVLLDSAANARHFTLF